MKKYIPNSIKVLLSFIPLFYTVGCIDQQGSEKPAEPKAQTYAVLQIDKLPQGIEGTLDSYLTEEKIEDRVSYHGISKVLCELNQDKPGAMMGSCQDLGDYDRISLKSGYPIRAPDYNGDSKIFGLKGKLVGVHEVYR
ncbi:MAG: hypothetical protein KAS15_00730 [Nanoarchaeota archaeon]|nr:hypothetical protein [Nanoarchaeota archaeon]MCK5630333.1 hypothetical protein [Nanoarchaeota archaeon]